MEAEVYEKMYRVENRHWCFCARRALIVSLLQSLLPKPRLNENPPRVCDIGCGCGMTLVELNRSGFHGIGIEPNEQALQFCRSRNVEVIQGTLPDQLNLPPSSMDAVLLLHVLEHVLDDEASVLAAYELLKPGGVLVCMVPAHPWLWSKTDEYSHHHRRYRRGEFKKVLTAGANSQNLLLSYQGLFLSPLLLTQRMLWKLFPPRNSGGGIGMPNPALNAFCRAACSLERQFLARRVTLPVGLGLIGAVRKPLT